jgi:hypothetical protein
MTDAGKRNLLKLAAGSLLAGMPLTTILAASAKTVQYL